MTTMLGPWLLAILGAFGSLLFATFATLCLAAGLMYLSEVVEEYTTLTKKVLRLSILTILGLLVVMGLFTDLPWLGTLLGLAAHALYFQFLKNFPFTRLMSPLTIGSVVVFVLHNVVLYHHFGQRWYPFDQVCAYMFICCWLVPLTLFVSLSSFDDALPTDGSASPNRLFSAEARPQAPKRGGGLLVGLKRWFEDMLPGRNKTF
eukprot:m.488314 g.488314  ORF g.488314 m.488314 type:complete len:204 (-) comp25707_c0_seq1:77-688(-)